MYFLKLYCKDPWILVPGVVALFLLGFSIWYGATHLPSSTEPIFLHYTTVFGVDLVGAAWKVFYIPLFGLGMGLLTVIFSLWLYRTERLLGRLLVLCYAIVQIFLAIGLWFILRLNL